MLKMLKVLTKSYEVFKKSANCTNLNFSDLFKIKDNSIFSLFV